MDKKHSEDIRRIADEYAKSRGLRLHHGKTQPLKEERSRSIAQMFQELKHQPASPEVKKAYRALIDETLAQYQSQGLK